MNPTGDDWLQTGTIAATMQNMWSDGKAKRVTADDFVPRQRPPKKPMSGDAMAAIFEAAMGNRIIR